jgi:hypothetical protein
MRAHRRRRAGLPEDGLPDGGRRGRVALAQLTKDELVLELAAIRANVSDAVEAIRAGRQVLQENSATPGALRRLEEIAQVFADLDEP